MFSIGRFVLGGSAIQTHDVYDVLVQLGQESLAKNSRTVLAGRRFYSLRWGTGGMKGRHGIPMFLLISVPPPLKLLLQR